MAGDKETIYEKVINWFKNKKAIVFVLILSALIIGLKDIIESIETIQDVFSSEDTLPPLPSKDTILVKIDDTTMNDIKHKNTTTNKYFNIESSEDYDNILAILKKAGYLKYNNSTQSNTIMISHSNEVKKVEGGDLYVFRGGHLVIKKDGQVCGNLYDIKLEALDYPANPRITLEEQIRSQIKRLANENAEQVAQVIIECL
ncbi:MAG: hypothetical protein HUU34_10165 [Saprospiraceae bacterium]|nr:hypothetical protein [Saprospiraceae bacterium]